MTRYQISCLPILEELTRLNLSEQQFSLVRQYVLMNMQTAVCNDEGELVPERLMTYFDNDLNIRINHKLRKAVRDVRIVGIADEEWNSQQFYSIYMSCILNKHIIVSEYADKIAPELLKFINDDYQMMVSFVKEDPKEFVNYTWKSLYLVRRFESVLTDIYIEMAERNDPETFHTSQVKQEEGTVSAPLKYTTESLQRRYSSLETYPFVIWQALPWYKVAIGDVMQPIQQISWLDFRTKVLTSSVQLYVLNAWDPKTKFVAMTEALDPNQVSPFIWDVPNARNTFCHYTIGNDNKTCWNIPDVGIHPVSAVVLTPDLVHRGVDVVSPYSGIIFILDDCSPKIKSKVSYPTPVIKENLRKHRAQLQDIVKNDFIQSAEYEAMSGVLHIPGNIHINILVETEDGSAIYCITSWI